MAQNDPIAEFMALPQDKQLTMLKALPRENQDRLLSQVKERRTKGSQKGPAPRKYTPSERAYFSDEYLAAHPRPEPTTVSAARPPAISMRGGIVPEFNKEGVKDLLVNTREKLVQNLPNIGGIVGGLVGAGLGSETGPGAIAASAGGAAVGGGAGEAARQAIEHKLHPEMRKLGPKKAAIEIGKEAALQGVYDLGGHAVGAAAKALPAAGKGFIAAKGALAPTEEMVEGVAVPQLLAERSPKSMGASVQRSLKKSGVGKKQFEDVAEQQQSAVKEAMRRSFQRASRRAVAPDEPAEMASAASESLRGRANPLYSRVWASRVDVPFDQGPLLQFGPIRDTWYRLMRREGIPESQQLLPNKSIGLMHQFRSELKAAAEASRNVNGRLDANGLMLSDAARDVDTAMRHSLQAQNPGALKMWDRANELWAQSYAMDEVSRVLAKTTEGTPVAAQVGGHAAAIPTEIQGASLVKRLNELDRDGTLARAFPDKGKAVRSLADMLDRAQTVKAADPNLWKANYMMRYGAELALATGAGLAAGKGKALNPSFAGAAVLAFLGARFGEGILVKMMTDKAALPIITKLATAADSNGVRKAANALYLMAPTLLRGGVAALNSPAPRADQSEQPAGGNQEKNPTDAWAEGVPAQ